MKAVTVGNVTLKLYRTRAGSWVFSYKVDGRRVQVHRATLAGAKKRAGEIAALLNRGNAAVLNLTPEDARAYARATVTLEPTGKRIETAIVEFAEAMSALPKGCRLVEAVEFFARSRPATVPDLTPVEVLAEMLTAKRQDGCSRRWLQDLENRCQRFADKFPKPLRAITGPEIDAWLRGLGVGGRTRNNYRLAVQTLFSFAARRRYLPPGWNEMAAVPLAKGPATPIGIFTPGEMRKLLGKAKPAMVPYLAIGAFAGLRAAEIERLDWSEVGLEYITVTAGKAKTAARRLVPVLQNLSGWLKPHRRTAGPVCPFVNVPNQIGEVAAAAGVKWRHNGLRHSFISYRVAQTQDVAQVALEAGNTPRMIFEHYRELVTAGAAKEWFKIMPP